MNLSGAGWSTNVKGSFIEAINSSLQFITPRAWRHMCVLRNPNIRKRHIAKRNLILQKLIEISHGLKKVNKIVSQTHSLKIKMVSHANKLINIRLKAL